MGEQNLPAHRLDRSEGNGMKRFISAIHRFDLSLQIVAGIALALMMVVTLIDVIMRSLGHPIIGSMEIISFAGAVVGGFAIPYASCKKIHIYVDFLQTRVSKTLWNAMQYGNKLIGIVLFAFIGYNFILYGLNLIQTGEVSPGFRIPYYPITFGLALSCFLETLTLLCDVLKMSAGEKP